MFDSKLNSIIEQNKSILEKQDHTADRVGDLEKRFDVDNVVHQQITDSLDNITKRLRDMNNRTKDLEDAWVRGKKRVEDLENDVENAKKKGIKFWLTISSNWVGILLFVIPWSAFFIVTFLFLFSPAFQMKVISALVDLLMKGM